MYISNYIYVYNNNYIYVYKIYYNSYFLICCKEFMLNFIVLCLRIYFLFFSVNNGIFRQYKSPRDKSSLTEFVSKKTWMKVDPISNWKSPTSFHMSILSQFFKLSQILRVSIYTFVHYKIAFIAKILMEHYCLHSEYP